jgi:hypothetical protein
METNAAAARETPQTETTPEAAPSMQTNAEAARETPQTETTPEAAPSMQTNAEAARETPQTETTPEAAPSMQTNAEAARETPQTETVSETTPIPLVQTFRAFQGPLNPTGDAKWEWPAAAPQLARAVPTEAVAKPSPSRQPKSLDDLIAQVGVASLPRPRPFFARTAKGQITQHIQPAAGQGVILKQYRDAAAPAPAPPMDAGRVITRQGANIRDAPTSSTVLRTVPRGTVLQVFTRRDGWIQVGQDVPMGWVYSSLLTDAREKHPF